MRLSNKTKILKKTVDDIQMIFKMRFFFVAKVRGGTYFILAVTLHFSVHSQTMLKKIQNSVKNMIV